MPSKKSPYLCPVWPSVSHLAKDAKGLARLSHRFIRTSTRSMYIFRALTHRNYRLHYIGQGISLLGTWMQRIAVSWLIYRLTDSALMLGIVAFVSLVPSLILSPFIGSFVDRYPKYRLMITTQAGMMLQSGILALLVGTGNYTVSLVIALSFVQGAINAFDVTVRQSIMAQLVDNKADLPNAIALNSTAFNMARMVGPAIGGVLLANYGEAACFTVNFLSYFVVLGTLLSMRLQEPPVHQKRISNWQGLVDGFQYLRRSNHLSSLIILLSLSSLFIIPYTTLLPVVAKEMFHGDATTFSWFESAVGLGAFAGAIYMARLHPHANLRFRVIAAALVFGAGIAALSLTTKLPLALLCTLLAAAGMMIQNSSINTYIQTHSMPAYRARAISYYIMAFQGVFPLGSLLVGFTAHTWGIQTTLLAQGIAGFLIGLSFLAYVRRTITKRYIPTPT